MSQKCTDFLPFYQKSKHQAVKLKAQFVSNSQKFLLYRIQKFLEYNIQKFLDVVLQKFLDAVLQKLTSKTDDSSSYCSNRYTVMRKVLCPLLAKLFNYIRSWGIRNQLAVHDTVSPIPNVEISIYFEPIRKESDFPLFSVQLLCK